MQQVSKTEDISKIITVLLAEQTEMSAPSAGLETNLLHLPLRFTNRTTLNAKQKLILRQDCAKFHDTFNCNRYLCTKDVIYLRTYYHRTSMN